MSTSQTESCVERSSDNRTGGRYIDYAGLSESALFLTGLSAANLFLSFFANLVITAFFGASAATDAYFVSSTFPLLVTGLVTTIGATALIPAFIDSYVKQGEEQAWRTARVILSVVMLIVACLATLGFFTSTQLIRLMAPGLNPDLGGDLLRWFAPLAVILVWNQMLTSIHHCCQRFIIPAVALSFPSLGIVLATLTLHDFLGIHAVVIGNIAGACMQAVILLPGLPIRLLRPSLDWRAPGVREAFRMIGCLCVGGTVHQFLPTIERFFASGFGEGVITHLTVANRVASALSTLLASGFAVTLFPRLSAEAATGRIDRACSTLSLCLRLLVVLAVPCLLFSPFYADTLVGLLFQRGRFGATDTLAVGGLLPYFILALVAAAVWALIVRAYYSLLHDALTPSIIVSALAFGYCLLCLHLRRYGATGLAIAYSAFWVTGVLVAALRLRSRLTKVFGRGVIGTLTRSTCATGLVMLGYWSITAQIQPGRAETLLLIGSCAIAYLLVGSYVFNLEEIGLALMKTKAVLSRYMRPAGRLLL